MTQPLDPVRDYLRQQGAPYQVIANGLRGLVENWERVVKAVEAGYDLSLDDYLNDMDGRQLLENALSVAPVEVRDAFLARVQAADERMRSLVVPAGRCLWGQIVAEEEGWRANKQWWYFTRPRQSGARLLEELGEGE
jgi:hypothetical protein